MIYDMSPSESLLLLLHMIGIERSIRNDSDSSYLSITSTHYNVTGPTAIIKILTMRTKPMVQTELLTKERGSLKAST